MGAAPRTLGVCADDFGIVPEVSAAIAGLAARQRLTAISCLVNGAHWPSAAKLLQALPAAVERGLHLNLTEGVPLSPGLSARWPKFGALGPLIVRAHLGALPRDLLRREFEAQLAAFVDAVGTPPAFIDGHQHIHHLPLLRELVLGLAGSLQPAPAVRSTARLLGPGDSVKRRIIEGTGGRALGRALRRRGIARNPALLGAYDFVDPNYRALMQRWLVQVPREGALLFCHPGRATPSDPIAAARERELAYLGSADFIDDLAAANVVLGSVWRNDRHASIARGP